MFSGVGDLRAIFAQAQENAGAGRETILFVDEIHRFNRAQQDSFLPYVENGTIILIGATTQNPSFELNGALLSRCRVLEVARLQEEHLEALLARAEAHMQRALPLDAQARHHLLQMADGDGRYVINLAESLFALPRETEPLSRSALAQFLQRRAPLYEQITGGALQPYLRLAQVNARKRSRRRALLVCAYAQRWRRSAAYIARRLVQFATEDVGLANPHALTHAIAAWQAYERLGSPEGELALANAVLFLASAPKSNAAWRALKEGQRHSARDHSLMPPKHILNAPTSMMRNFGYGHRLML